MGGYLGPVKVGRRKVNELNLSADPEASYDVLNAPCPVTLMNAQVCLQAPFAWKDYRKLKFWSRKTRRSVRDWLILHGLFCSIPHFYLWDLLPAVYLFHPGLFQDEFLKFQSSVNDLEQGFLKMGESGGEQDLNMPVRIRDYQKFLEVLFTAWQKVEV